MINYTIINSALNITNPPPMSKEILYCIHNAGFFSNSTIRLMDIVNYYNRNGKLPDEVDSSVQWLHYKSYPGDRLDTFYFEPEQHAEGFGKVDSPYITTDCMAIQFHPYHNIKFEQLKPFVDKYFAPGKPVKDVLATYEAKYSLDYANLCAVFYRGNSKFREMKVASYDYFIDKAREVKAQHPSMKFLVQPDEREFLEAFQREFPNDTIYFTETPMIQKMDSDNFFELPLNKRKEQGTNFFAALLAISKCHTVITHSGNCGFWTALYRGNATNLYQIFNDEWI